MGEYAEKGVIKSDPLGRFLKRQEEHYELALRELTQGKKENHWVWYIFPQLRGLGRSQMAFNMGIADIEEAKAYLEHPVLGPRLIACCEAMLLHKDKTALEILGEVDAMKFRSCATLFMIASGGGPVFKQVLDQFYEGCGDEKTKSILIVQEILKHK